MRDLSEFLLDLIVRHGAWSGPIVGALAFLESLVIIGLFVPAIASMIAIGGLIGAGIVDPAPVLIFAITGAILGDWVSYLLGQSMGSAVYRHRWLRAHRLAFARARLFFRRYGFVSILLGRFLGPIRSTIPVVAGVLKMPRGVFQGANILSAVIWVPALLAPGYFAGARAADLGIRAEYIMPIAIALCVLPFLGGWVILRLFSKPRRRPAARMHRRLS
ncbi:MAG TPA: DedA family protein [Sphingobium sp.]|nr:DedA family protein [Sphingobium sp.]